jgi:hypothetical protein
MTKLSTSEAQGNSALSFFFFLKAVVGLALKGLGFPLFLPWFF